ncbi:hypothetical protein HDV02_004693, partial [Globomyces sp. JEL0801]
TIDNDNQAKHQKQSSVIRSKWNGPLITMITSLYEKSKPIKVVYHTKVGFDKEKLRQQMREEGFWKKYKENDI